jgi:hypothetical protein
MTYYLESLIEINRSFKLKFENEEKKELENLSEEYLNDNLEKIDHVIYKIGKYYLLLFYYIIKFYYY